MAKLLVFQGDRKDTDSAARLFVERLNMAARHTVAGTVRYTDLVFHFANASCSVTIAATGQKLEDAADVYYVRDNRGYQAERYAIARYLVGKGRRVFNSDILHNEPLSKLEQLVALTQAGISVPIGSFASDPQLLVPFGYPHITKSIVASNNRYNFLVHSDEERQAAIKKIGGKKVLAQEYIENDGDYKVIVMFGRPLAIYKRERPNQYMHGDRPLRKAVQDGDVAALASKVAAVLQREFCGVDIVRDKASGALYVLECNFNAGLSLAGIGYDEMLFSKTATMLQDL